MYDAEYITLLHSSMVERTSTILISYLATEQKIEQILKIEWYNPNTDSSENRFNMKYLGASAMRYRDFLQEMTIIAVSKSIEDLINDIDEFCNIKVNFWKLDANTRYYAEMKMVRNSCNCIKHSNGVVADNSKQSNRYLIDNCDFIPDYPVTHNVLHYEEIILKSLLFQDDLLSKVLGTNTLLGNISEDNISKVKNILLPPILNLK